MKLLSARKIQGIEYVLTVKMEEGVVEWKGACGVWRRLPDFEECSLSLGDCFETWYERLKYEGPANGAELNWEMQEPSKLQNWLW